MSRGLLIVLSGPSGCGKGTLLKRFFEVYPNAAYSVSATTRPPREGESDGRDYRFISKEKFEEMISKGEFLEYANYLGNYYGTPVSEVEKLRGEGRDVILEIEVQGAFQIRERCPDALMVFVSPSSMDIVESRLRHRGTEDEYTIRSRLDKARDELACMCSYDFRIVNDGLEESVEQLKSIVEGKKKL